LLSGHIATLAHVFESLLKAFVLLNLFHKQKCTVVEGLMRAKPRCWWCAI